MDLFAAAGIDLGDGGRGGRPGRSGVGRTLRVSLLSYKVIAEALKRVNFDPTKEQLEIAQKYAEAARSPRFRANETRIRNRFYDEILGTLLGYRKYDPDQTYTVDFEHSTRGGSADVALGHFSEREPTNEVIAPFEMKGPLTVDLDAIPPGGRRSPVQQAWDYAVDTPGSRWVLVSNCLEIRLYGFGRGRDAYELFDLTKLDDRGEHEKLWLILSAGRLLTGATDTVLRDTDNAYKDITDKLYVEYKTLRDRLIAFLTGAADGPKLPMKAAIEVAQKSLDRILFIAFAERTDLLPMKLLERAANARNEFRPEPYWKNFQALFHEIDVGNEGRGIWAYNGGLFAPDVVADAVVIPDPLATDLGALGQWDYKSDVPVTVLGHIFEQSVTDLEKLRAESRGEEPPKISKRKREGVVYTPDIVTRFLVERTIGVAFSERFSAILTAHGRKLPKNGDPIFGEKEKDAERSFWRDYAGSLRSLRVVDPACGSGAFLVAAFDLFAREYRRVVTHLIALGESVDFDPFDEILTKNLHGVDLNAESVEITRLALWLKTARNKHRLQNLEATIKVGNSLIDDRTFTDQPFDWRTAFADVPGGFDVVIGNPPYVRMELIKPFKPYLEKHYVVADDRTDLYAYFFERGVSVLKPGGRLGYISSSTFFRTGSGENLRKFLGDNVAVEAVIDFGDLQLFEGVTTYPAIITLHKGVVDDEGTLSFLKIAKELPTDLDAEFTARATAMPRARLGAGSWQLEDDTLARLRDKIVKGKKTLGEVYGAPLRGIVTGLNDAFVVDQVTHDRLVKSDKKSAKLLKPFLRGENVKRWRVEPEGLFLINTPKGDTNIGDYPAIRDWLLPFKPQLEKRAGNQEWWELQQAQVAYHSKFEAPKILYPDITDNSKFSADASGSFIDCTLFLIADADTSLLAYLNSKVAWYFWKSLTPELRGGFVRLKSQYVSLVPMPELSKETQTRLVAPARTCSEAARQRFEARSAVSHRILDLAPPGRRKLSRKLDEWWAIDFTEFRAEVKRLFRIEIPVKERSEWETYLADQAAELRKLDAQIEKAEREIDAIIYRLFDLTPDEVALLEASIAGQH
jgi:TaqI-like C-terminal specificity domain/N-6 DNA Methylase